MNSTMRIWIGSAASNFFLPVSRKTPSLGKMSRKSPHMPRFHESSGIAPIRSGSVRMRHRTWCAQSNSPFLWQKRAVILRAASLCLQRFAKVGRIPVAYHRGTRLPWMILESRHAPAQVSFIDTFLPVFRACCSLASFVSWATCAPKSRRSESLRPV